MANERRLIDANALPRRTWLDGTVLVMAVQELDEAPTVDAVEVCFCKDCKYWEPIRYGYRTDGLCLCLSKYHDAERPGTEGDFYCSYGEKREVE